MNAPSPKASEVINLGCRLNIAEAERMRAMLAKEEDVVVINSCAVTSEAVRQTRQTIRKARRERPDARLIVTGCAADIEREALGAMDEVDGLIPNASKLDPRAWNIPADKAPLAPTKTRAFIAVQNGCDHACTFCVIPQGRGKSRSLDIADVLNEVEQHLELGAKEIVLTGVDLTSWGQDISNTPQLGKLVHSILNAFHQLTRLRLSSMDGIEVDPLLEDMIASEERIMPHIHLSLQHGADLILKRMKRRHLRGDAVNLVERLKARRPDIAIGADLMAGFPTESADHHAENLSIIKELDIVHGHIFPFSPRPRTPAAKMPQLDRSIIKARAAELRACVANIREDWLQAHVGKSQSVLAERDGTGYAPDYARIAVPHTTPAGSIVSVTPNQIKEGMLQ
ncbi:MAG: MiaB/RimO family radical SAM methylthiotransferase [Pseudomonadota bacterium]